MGAGIIIASILALFSAANFLVIDRKNKVRFVSLEKTVMDNDWVAFRLVLYNEYWVKMGHKWIGATKPESAVKKFKSIEEALKLLNYIPDTSEHNISKISSIDELGWPILYRGGLKKADEIYSKTKEI
jgi:hypothetical protein